MASNIDFNALRARTLGSGDDEEAVTVNTRALIDKVLARYSGEWTVLRELLQNAADASATRVTVKFETIPSTTVPAPSAADPSSAIKHVISHHTIKRLVVTNNGQPFNSNDWSRLKRIAEGNPDETKIGAFGVGFYSVFADSEEPFVSSGREAMAFYWKGNALFTRRLQLNEAESSSDTNFVLDYRNTTSPVPSLMPLCKFLASSLTFVGLEGIELWLDDWNVFSLSKKTAPSVSVSIPRDIETKTGDGLMKVTGVSQEVAQIDAKWMAAVEWKDQSTLSSRLEAIKNNDTTASLRSFFSRLTRNANSSSDKVPQTVQGDVSATKEDLFKIFESSVFLRVHRASIKTSVSSSFSSELERATKKPPPRTTTLAILTTSYGSDVDPREASSRRPANSAEIFASVLPSKSGRIFIGFPTHQTTGLCAHISAPSVIPTVERESIDLNARWVRSWNIEMLRATGIVCRIAWSAEMASLKDRLPPSKDAAGRYSIHSEDIERILPEAIHGCNQFVFREATPSSQVGRIIEDAFWTCNRNASIEVLSTCGIMASHQVRIAPKDLSFMNAIPVLPERLIKEAKEFVQRLTDFGLVTEIMISDVKKELESNALTHTQLGEFLLWISERSSRSAIDHSTVRTLLDVAVANDEIIEGSPTRLIILGDIRTFLNPNRISVDLPVPPSTMPFKFTKGLQSQNLVALGWRELDIVSWIRWLAENAADRSQLPLERDLTRTAAFSAQVLPVLSKNWDHLDTSSKGTVIRILSTRTVMPTKAGMKAPSETYFPSVKLFDDLPVVTGLHGVKEKFLAALGVRKTVELGVIFDRLLNSTPDLGEEKSQGRRRWSHVDLIKYLASVREDIPASDIERLKNTRICTLEGKETQSDARALFKVSDLFEPTQTLRDLGLPLLEWPGKYDAAGKEGKFLTMLGLRAFPTARELVQMMAQAASEDKPALQAKAMAYFITQHEIYGYAAADMANVTVPFLPLENSQKLSVPSRCFTDDGARLFGFEILRRDLHVHASKFGVKPHPPLNTCIDMLIRKPPPSKREAKVMFQYFNKRLSEIGTPSATRLGHALIVPISKTDPDAKTSVSGPHSSVTFAAPEDCYLGQSEDYSELFNFVDFGEGANRFLTVCGSKPEPTKIELARLLVKEPARINAKFQNPEKYLKLLRTLADNLTLLVRDKTLIKEMKTAPFLLASRELPSQATPRRTDNQLIELDDQDLDEEERGIKEWHLVKAADAIIVDDFPSFGLFKENILAAPQEETLEQMYSKLGTPCLSQLVDENARIGILTSDQRLAEKVQKRIYERSRLFLFDQAPEAIKHDPRWLEKNLRVQVVQNLNLRRSLRGRNASHTEQRSALGTHDHKGWNLWIVPGSPNFYHISQALSHVLLHKPKIHSTLTLETLLKSDLMELKTRGYNVSRILQKKEAEARLAENQRQQQLAEERKLIQKQEDEWRMAEEQRARETQEQGSMPGVFPDSPSNNKANREVEMEKPPVEERPRSLFSNLTRRLGFDDGGRANPPTSFQDTAPDAPPPYSANDSTQQQQQQQQQRQTNGTVSSPHLLQSNLLNAIQSSRPHGSSGVFSPGETNQVTETKSYCDEKPSQDLQFAADSRSGMKIFVIRGVDNVSSFLTSNAPGLDALASVLVDCASIFALRVDSVSIFYDPGTKTIAFNRQGSIFCNYLYFQQLHQAKLLQTKDKSDALVYWWVILCHELAHNLVSDHSSDHSYYTEGFVSQYFAKTMQKLHSYQSTTAIPN